MLFVGRCPKANVWRDPKSPISRNEGKTFSGFQVKETEVALFDLFAVRFRTKAKNEIDQRQYPVKIYSSPVKKNRVTLSLKCASFSFIFGLFKNEIIFTTNTCAKLGCRHSTVDSSVAFHSAAPGLSPKHTIYALIIYSQICAMFVMWNDGNKQKEAGMAI